MFPILHDLMVPFWQRLGFEILEILEIQYHQYLYCKSCSDRNKQLCLTNGLQVIQQPAKDLVQCKLKEVCLDRERGELLG